VASARQYMFTSYTTAWAKKPCQLPFQCFWAGQQHKALKGPSATRRPQAILIDWY